MNRSMFAICEFLSLLVEFPVSTGTGLPHLGRYPRTSGTERSVGAMLLSYPAAKVVWVSMSVARGLAVGRRRVRDSSSVRKKG